MKKSKLLFVVILAVCFVLSLALFVACDNTKRPEGSKELRVTTNIPEAVIVSGSGYYFYNDNIKATATIKDGYEFLGWYVNDDDCVSKQTIYNGKMWNQDVEFSAKVIKIPETAQGQTSYEYGNTDQTLKLTVKTIDASYGLVSLDNQSNQEKYTESCRQGQSFKVLAFSKTSDMFAGWYGLSGELITTNATFTMTMPYFDFMLIAAWGDVSNINEKLKLLRGEFNDELSADAFTFKPIGDGEEYAVIGCTSVNNILSIPSFYKGKPVTSIGVGAFAGCSSLTSIVIPDGVTSIDLGAFQNCSGLTSVTIGNSVTSIGSSAFYGCSKLTTVTIPDGVTSIGHSAFSYCHSLTSITIPDSVTWIGNYAFSGCNSLTSITIPNSVTSIGYAAFVLCSSLTSVTIPDSVTSIGDSAFSGCYRLVEVYNKSALNITIGAFTNGCAGYYAKNVYTPNSGASKLSTVGDGFIIYTDGNLISLIGYTGNKTELTLPDNITEINQCAFYNCSKLTSVVIPNSVTSIGYGAFYGCSSLTSVTIGNSVASIGESAFGNCSKLTSITIPDGVTSIGNRAFSDCGSLTSITIPDSVTSIGYEAFRGCSSLTSVTFKKTSGWKVSKSSTATSGTSVYVTNATQNAAYLKSTYLYYYWKRS